LKDAEARLLDLVKAAVVEENARWADDWWRVSNRNAGRSLRFDFVS